MKHKVEAPLVETAAAETIPSSNENESDRSNSQSNEITGDLSLLSEYKLLNQGTHVGHKKSQPKKAEKNKTKRFINNNLPNLLKNKDEKLTIINDNTSNRIKRVASMGFEPGKAKKIKIDNDIEFVCQNDNPLDVINESKKATYNYYSGLIFGIEIIDFNFFQTIEYQITKIVLAIILQAKICTSLRLIATETAFFEPLVFSYTASKLII